MHGYAYRKNPNPLWKPLTSMNTLVDLIGMIPKGRWSHQEDKIIDPQGNEIIYYAPELSEVDKKLYVDVICELLNGIPNLLEELTAHRNQISGLFRELNHYKARNLEFYRKAIIDAAAVVSNIPVKTATAKNALNTVIERLEVIQSQITERLHDVTT